MENLRNEDNFCNKLIISDQIFLFILIYPNKVEKEYSETEKEKIKKCLYTKYLIVQFKESTEKLYEKLLKTTKFDNEIKFKQYINKLNKILTIDCFIEELLPSYIITILESHYTDPEKNLEECSLLVKEIVQDLKNKIHSNKCAEEQNSKLLDEIYDRFFTDQNFDYDKIEQDLIKNLENLDKQSFLNNFSLLQNMLINLSKSDDCLKWNRAFINANKNLKN